jgi:hypothetical protein
MEYSDETRRYLAKVSRIGIIAATLYALIYGMLHFFLTPSKYAYGFQLSRLFIGQHNVCPEITVFLAGALTLTVCGILSMTTRGKPALAEKAWIIAGKAVLLSAPVGYIQSLCGMNHLLTAVSSQTEFLFSFATLATVFGGYALGAKGISVNQRFLNVDRKTYTRRVLRNTAIVFGVMLVSVLLLIGRQWKMYGAVLQNSTGLTILLWIPLRASAPAALTVILGYPLLSLAARWDEAPRKGRFGKGTLLLGWVTLAISVWYQIMAVMIQTRILDYTAGSLMEDLQDLQNMQAMQQIIATVGTLLGIWTLCRILSRVRESKAALWGVRSVLGVIILRHLFTGVVGVIRSAIQLKNQSGVGIIGGADYTLTVLTAKLESWANILFTILTIAALCILTVGLTRHCRVSKAFWAVPVLTAATVGVSLLVAIIWELFLRNTSLETLEAVRTVFLTVIPAVLTVARSLVGIFTLTCAPAEEIPPIPPALNGREPAKPRMEDYLYQL